MSDVRARLEALKAGMAPAKASEILRPGMRNAALSKTAVDMRRSGVPEFAIRLSIYATNEYICSPPLADWELDKIVEASGIPGAPIVAPNPFPTVGWDVIADDLPPINWISQALGIAKGAVTLFGGAGYGGKTMVLQALLLAVASGTPIWGHYDDVGEPGRVAHFDFEQGPHLTHLRFQRLARGRNIDLRSIDSDMMRLSSLPRAGLDASRTSEDHVARICDGAKIAVIDAFRGAFPSAKENDSEVRKYLDMLQHASERTGCAMNVVMHSRKPNKDEDIRSALRGSGALFDSAQTVYMLESVAGKPTRVHNTKDRIRGETRPTFGLQISDDACGSDDPRRGLVVEYVTPEDVQAAYLKSDDVDRKMAMTAERFATFGERVMALVKEEGTALTTIIAFGRDFGASATDVRAVVHDMVSKRELEISHGIVMRPEF